MTAAHARPARPRSTAILTALLVVFAGTLLATVHEVSSLSDQVSAQARQIRSLQHARQIVTTSAGPAQPQQCPANVSPACAAWQDANTSRVVQDIELLDRKGAVIWWCNNAGGCWVGNDLLGVTGRSVYNRVAYLAPTANGLRGVLVLDGQALTSADISALHRLLRR